MDLDSGQALLHPVAANRPGRHCCRGDTECQLGEQKFVATERSPFPTPSRTQQGRDQEFLVRYGDLSPPLPYLDEMMTRPSDSPLPTH